MNNENSNIALAVEFAGKIISGGGRCYTSADCIEILGKVYEKITILQK